jgi:hypothetical protein
MDQKGRLKASDEFDQFRDIFGIYRGSRKLGVPGIPAYRFSDGVAFGLCPAGQQDF